MGLFGICHVVQIVYLYAYIYMYVLYICVVENYATSQLALILEILGEFSKFEILAVTERYDCKR